MKPRAARAASLLVLALAGAGAVLAGACRAKGRPENAPPLPGPGRAGELRVPARGAVTALALTGGALSFCDAAGLHTTPLPGTVSVNAPRGQREGAATACPPGGLAPRATGPEISVRNPDHGPDDILEIEGVAASFPLDGHAQDWASDGTKTVIVATASRVLQLDPSAHGVVELSQTGAQRVAAGEGWVAWADGSTVVARPSAESPPAAPRGPQVDLPRP